MNRKHDLNSILLVRRKRTYAFFGLGKLHRAIGYLGHVVRTYDCVTTIFLLHAVFPESHIRNISV